MKTASILLLVLFVGLRAHGQESRRFFIGVQPGATIEKDNSGEFTYRLNTLPLQFQVYLGDLLAMRLTTLMNYDVEQKAMAQLGGELAMPVYVLGKRRELRGGPYLAPLAGLSHNRLSGGEELTLALEPGYSWVFDQGFSMHLGLQLGASYFNDPLDMGWRNHTGLKFSLGYTF